MFPPLPSQLQLKVTDATPQLAPNHGTMLLLTFPFAFLRERPQHGHIHTVRFPVNLTQLCAFTVPEHTHVRDVEPFPLQRHGVNTCKPVAHFSPALTA